MPVLEKNLFVFGKLEEMAQMLTKLNDENRAKSFTRAANTVRDLETDISEVKNLQSLAGVGKSIEKEIKQLLEKQTTTRYEELTQAVKDAE